MMWNGGYDGGWSMWLFMVLGIVGLWTLVFLLVRQAFSDRCPDAAQHRVTPLAELDSRLARGEVTAEDYAAARRLLSEGH